MDEFNSRLDIPKERVNELKITQKKYLEQNKERPKDGKHKRSRKIKQNENVYYMSDDSHSRRGERGCGRGPI